MSPLQLTILEILDLFKDHPVVRTKLVKLVYFIDYIYFQHVGRTLTGVAYVWDHFGPNAAHDEIVKAAEELVKLNAITVRREKPNAHGGVTHYYRPNLEQVLDRQPLDVLGRLIVNDVVGKYRNYTAGEIADASKLTPPFEHATQQGYLEFDREDAFYKTAPPPQDLTREQVEAIEEDEGIGIDEVLAKYGLA